MNKKFSIKAMWPLLKKSFKGFSEDKVPKLSASLAYYTVFSLAPLLVVIISLAGIFLGQEAAQGTIVTQMRGLIGEQSAGQVQEMVQGASLSGKSNVALIIGIVTLIIGATSMFGEMQDSINGIWGLKSNPKAGLKGMIVSRLLSFGMIVSLGFLLLVSLAATAVVEGLGERLQSVFPGVPVTLFYIINLVLTLGVTTVLFAGIFKVLPDAKIQWKHVWVGAAFTAVLFMIGKFLIGLYIGKSDVGSTYGSAGSLIVLLTWIYYSSFILFLGAEFTKHYLVEYGPGIIPDKWAMPMEGSIVASAEPKKQPATAAPVPADPQQPWRTRPYPGLAVSGPRDPHSAHADMSRKGTQVGGVKAIMVAMLAAMTGAIRRGRG
ncbi:YihY/virulence factor BrkB family protein [Flaviaesturariibacter amylovorans]|uniref:YihY/virulence factor BrkB family protein n=1 Tax=Flaviaesturariibacter amylovorans TaxID=1084520 RepID=A0ABP8GE96_9BACT